MESLRRVARFSSVVAERGAFDSLVFLLDQGVDRRLPSGRELGVPGLYLGEPLHGIVGVRDHPERRLSHANERQRGDEAALCLRNASRLRRCSPATATAADGSSAVDDGATTSSLRVLGQRRADRVSIDVVALSEVAEGLDCGLRLDPCVGVLPE